MSFCRQNHRRSVCGTPNITSGRPHAAYFVLMNCSCTSWRALPSVFLTTVTGSRQFRNEAKAANAAHHLRAISLPAGA